MAEKKVVIIGGGIAGLAVANTLAERGAGLKPVIVTKDPYYVAGPSRPLILTGEQSFERITRGYEEVAGRGVEIVYGTVYRVDPAERKVYLAESPTRPAKQRVLDYDYLVIAPGVVFDGSGIEGYERYWWRITNVYEPGTVVRLKKRLWSDTKGSIIVYAPKAPYRCAPAPAETALLAHTVLAHRGVRKNFRIVHVDANPKIQPPVIADRIAELYEQAGIELVTGQEIVEIGENHVVLANGEQYEYTILAMLPPNRAPSFIAEAGLGDNWVEVRSPQDLRSPRYDDILAAGDAAKLPFPKNQEIAFESALFAANRILEAEGAGEPVSVQYAFIGWAYVGNIEGKLETLSLQFGLNFTTKPPKPSKDPVPKREYTLQKDRWEQAYLAKLFHH